jgi:hypothetical protein
MNSWMFFVIGAVLFVAGAIIDGNSVDARWTRRKTGSETC